RLEIDLKVYNVAFNMPKQYVECDSGFNFYCGDRNITNGITYSIIKKDSSVKIGFAFCPTPPKKDIEALKTIKPGTKLTNRNINYLRNAIYRADTIHHKIIYYDSGFAKQMFNAEHALAITRNCTLIQG